MQERNYPMCSDRSVRSLATKLAHARLREADEDGQPTLGKFGSFLSNAYRQVRTLAESMAQEECQLLSYDEVRELIQEESEDVLELGGEDEMVHDEVNDEEIELGSAEDQSKDEEEE